MAPYRATHGGAPWLTANLTLASLGAMDNDMAELARRTSVSSWLFT